ncbi:MAG: RNA polymerase sigma factor [Oscillospiraceae bacterium]|nr:RNA polymerase sigma factor [Oscillospiraceae bacterium]
MNELSDLYDKLYRYCYYKTNNSFAAEDITQETFLRYFAQKTKINRQYMIRYLYTIAKNLCIDSYRKVKMQELTDELPDKDFSESSDTRVVVRQAIKELPPMQSEVLILRYVNGLYVNDTAAIMNLSRFSVYRIEKAAVRALKEKLEKEDFHG